MSSRWIMLSILALLPELAIAQPNAAGDSLQKGIAAATRGAYRIAISNFDEAIRLDPKSAPAYYNRCVARNYIGEHDRAIHDCDKAIQLDAKVAPIAYNARGLVYANLKQYGRAIQDYDTAIRFDPRLVYAYYNRGLANASLKQYDRAVQDYNQAIRIDPGYVRAYNNLAWLYATATNPAFHNGKRAVELANKACELTEWKVARTMGTLAAAYARNGDFANAVRWQERAITDSEYIKEFPGAHERLQLYRSGKPYTNPINGK